MTVVVTLMLIKYEKRYDYSMVKNVYEIASNVQLFCPAEGKAGFAEERFSEFSQSSYIY